MTLEEVEQRLRSVDVSWGEQIKFADAIREHLRDCVDAEKVRKCRDWMLRMSDSESRKGMAAAGTSAAFHECWRQLDALLPPSPSALERAIAMVENSSPSMRREIEWPGPLLALLQEAQAERK